jgi:plasmid stability protein
MKDSYDFSNAKHGPVIESKGKTRITMWVDDDVLAAFRARAAQQGKGYQTLMNDALRSHSREEAAPVTMEVLRTILREIIHEELHPA